MQGAALKRPTAYGGCNFFPSQRLSGKLPIGFGSLHLWAVYESSHCGHGLCMATIGVALLLRCESFKCAPLDISHGADINHGVRLGRRSHFIKQQGSTGVALGRRHASKRQCLVVWMRLGKGRKQEPMWLIDTQCFGDSVDERRRIAQPSVCKVPARRCRKAHDARGLIRLCKARIAQSERVAWQRRLHALLASSDNDGVYMQTMALS